MKNRPVKGKVPHADWPAIILRHQRGEPLSKIADDYGCTAPAISYILRRARSAGMESPAKEAVAGDLPTHRKAAPRREQSPPAEPGFETAREAPGKPLAEADDSQSFPRGLRQLINDDIASFVVALEAAIVDTTLVNVDVLLDASERLMQAAARARIEGARLRAHALRESERQPRRMSIVGDAPSRRM